MKCTQSDQRRKGSGIQIRLSIEGTQDTFDPAATLLASTEEKLDFVRPIRQV